MSVKVRKLYGETWGLVIHHQGQRRKIAVGGKRAAELMAMELELELAKGRTGIVSKDKTFAEIAARWMEGIELRRAPMTVRRYRGMLATINGYIGKLPIEQITRGNIRDMLMQEYKQGAARATVELMHAVASGVFHHAVEDGIIATSPTLRILSRLDLPKESEEIMPLSAEEMAAALAAVDAEVRPLFTLLYETGCRVGEGLALTWGDVDFRNRKITISKTAKGQTIRTTTKGHSARTIDMSDTLHAMLAELHRADKISCLAAGIERKLVCHKLGKVMSDNTLRRKWSAACERIGIGHRRIHDIRHTTASILLARGAPITYVSKLLGHSSTTITLQRYAHWLPSENTGAVNLLSQEPSFRAAGGAFEVKKTA